MHRKILAALAAAALALFTLPAHAALRVLACEPEWAALAKELGGDLVDATSATSALQDPHRIQARPSLIARVRTADLVVCTGAELEIGWLPVLLQQSGNDRVQPGQPGNFASADYVRKLDVPAQVDRSQGDVHAAGNPHIQTSHWLPRHCPRACGNSTRRTRPSTRGARPTSRGAGSRRSSAGPRRPRRSGAHRSCRSTRPSSTCTTGSA